MNLTLDISISALTVFIQGVLSFLSPCVLPILPVYIGYFSGSAKTIEEDGTVTYNQKKVFLHTLLFVLGVSTTFFVLGFSFTAFGQFFSNAKNIISIISGLLMILFGMYQLGIFKRIIPIETERRFKVKFDLKNLGLLSTYMLGFTFSFAWTPCIGPIFAGVLLMASSTTDTARAFLLILCYTLGFVIPFLAVGVFTSSILGFFKQHQNIIKYTIKMGAILLILMGIITLSGFTSINFDSATENTETVELTEEESEEPITDTETTDEVEENIQDEIEIIPIFDFTLQDQYGQTHTLSDYNGKVVFLNFWATWCSPCKEEMPYIQTLYEQYGLNEDDVIILGVARPNSGQEKDSQYIADFLSENEYTFPVVMDENGDIFSDYQISAFPTTFMIDMHSNIYGYVMGSLSFETMESIIEQTFALEETYYATVVE